jgi:hypothetical protein
VVASRNCGNWALCHPDLLVDPPVVGEYAARAERAVKEPFRRDHDPFGSDRSAAELEDLLAVF